MAEDKLETDLSVAPYHDDFNESKQFVKVLFKPALAVQTRELNQIQTVLQNQTSRFANHIFKEGSVVDGCALTYNSKQNYVHLKNNFTTHTSASVEIVDSSYLVVSLTTGVRAIVDIAKKGFEALYPATNRWYVSYIKTGKDVANADVPTFLSGETLTVYNANQSKLGTLDPLNIYDTIQVVTAVVDKPSVGTGYTVKVSDGIIYQKGYFSKVLPQRAIVREFDQVTTNMAIGFKTAEAIITSDQDNSLLDNANGQPNTNAPGADRLRLTPILYAVDKTTLDTNSTFFPIAEFNDTIPVEQNIDPMYNILGDVIKGRTYDESGDYVLKPFQVESFPHTSNTSLMNYEISTGIGYVKGARVELIGSKRTEVPRAITTEESQAEIVTANYGNYVYVNEAVGNFDIDNIATIDIYDTAQTTITDVEGATSAPSGTKIGTANVRNFVYSSGTKGTIAAQWRLYITNIIMNSGKSFSKDAKSFYVNGTYGKAKADLVLVGGLADIKESTKDNLVFDFGINTIKRLTDKNGVNDTQFIFRDTANATLQANGFATFTLNTPYAGGNERLNASVGALSDSQEALFDFSLSAAAVTSNLAGTITVATTTATGTGTAFTTDFVVGNYVQINAAPRRITAIANNTSMTINATVTATANVYQRYYPEGHLVDMTKAGAQVTVISNTQFSVQTGLGTLTSATQPLRANFPVLRTSAVAIKKEIKKDRYVKIDCTANTGGPWNLGLIDIATIKAVYVGATYANTNPNRIDWFYGDNGQTNASYEHGKLVVKPQYKANISAATRILVQLDHFTANTSAGAGFFSIDSYPVIKETDTANSTNIAIAAIPLSIGKDVRQVVDFRPFRYNTANSAVLVADATVNPAAANSSFVNVTTGSYIPDADSNFQADVEYYLPRIDVLSITKDGEITVKRGIPSLNPKTPADEPSAMKIATVKVPAYPSMTTREAELYIRPDLSTTINLSYNRRYTMKDIGVLDQRISRLEYYTVLNALEQTAKDMTVPDANGLDRFKNGIFAEPFRSHGLGNVGDFEYKIAIDADNAIARPYFVKRDVDFQYSTSLSSNTSVNGPLVTLPFSSELYITQPYATKIRNCTESVWKWTAEMALWPTYDYAVEEKYAPAVNVTLDLAAGWEEFANSPFGAQYGDWRTTATSTDVRSAAIGSTASASTTNTSRSTGRSGQTTTSTVTNQIDTTIQNTITTNTTQQRLITEMNVDVSTASYDLGTSVTDVALNPYMKSREVAFIIHGLKPNTKLYAFFDKQAVSDYCAPGVLSGVSSVSQGKENLIVNRTGAYGAQLTSNADGTLYGMFKIPEASFRVGDRVFRVVNVDNLVTGADAILTSAEATYTASSMTITSQQTTLNTRNPTITSSTRTESNVITDVSTTTNVVRSTTSSSSSNFGSGSTGNNGSQGHDPITQSFLITAPSEVTGAFVDKIGVYFNSKDPTLGVTAFLVEMTGGFPDTSKVIAKKHLTSAQVSTSSNGTVETVFDFDGLLFLNKDKYYAVMVKPDGDSPEYTIWMSEIGQTDVVTGQQIFSNPYIGTAFISANSVTWTPLQTEDLKFNIYRAKFQNVTGTVTFENEDDEFLTVDGFTKVYSNQGIQVGDEVRKLSAGVSLVGPLDPYGVVQSTDEAVNSLILDTSNGKWTVGDTFAIHRPFFNGETTIGSLTMIAWGTITEIRNRDYSVIVPRFASLEPVGASIAYKFKGMANTGYIADSTYVNVTPETDNEFNDQMRTVASKSNEVTLNSGNKSAFYQLTLNTINDFVSPVLDLTRKTSYVIRNDINNDITNEHTRYGNALTRYLSKPVVLAENQDAEDIMVYLTAYRPAATDLNVYIKFLNAEDTENFDTKVWTKLNCTSGASVFSSTSDKKDFKEYEFSVPSAVGVTGSAWLNGGNFGIVQYAAASGAVYIGYKTFMIKVVPTADSRARVPFLKDLRALCLQK